jgi:serine phosphatase RsbU (regulator of sigma subunit)/anti-sigma regulatory factor (Ser/Thr protein kinase)
LPADHRSPATARATVREVLAQTGLWDLMDEALLLTTELSTNGVIHAGTELDVDVIADPNGLTVTVTDYKGGPIEAPFPAADVRTPRPRQPDELAEHGRGLLLVDRFATAWGTTHSSHGKGVWFRLELDTAGPTRGSRIQQVRDNGRVPPGATAAVGSRTARPTTGVWPVEPPPAGASRVDRPPALPANHAPPRAVPGLVPTPESLIWLVHVPEEVRLRLSPQQLVSELLLRLCEVTGSSGAAVWLDRGDGRGEQRLASYGNTGDASGNTTPALTVSLPLTRPVSASLSLYADGGGAVSEHWEPLAQLTAERMAITVEADRLREDDLRRRSWLTFLAEASELLAQSLDVRLTMALVPQIVVPRLGEWCAVHVMDEWGDLRLAASMHADESALPALQRQLGPTNQELPDRLREALQSQSPVALGRPLEGIVVPLSARGKALGTLSVGRPPHRLHGVDDVAVIEDVSRRASLAIDNSRTHAERAEIAQAFQRALLPSALPNAVGLEFGSEYVSASSGTDVGGDFYDVIEVTPRRWLVAIGDVCGKGAQAAALTGLVRDVIRVLVRDGRCLPRAIQLLNRTLIEQHDDGRYCTLAAAMVTRNGEDLEVELCLAGHERPMLVHVDGKVEQVGINGTAVGLLDDVLLRPAVVNLAPGEALVFFTDGVTERRRGEELYGLGRLRRELASLAGHSAQVVAARLRGAVLSFSENPPRDDIAILVVRNLGAQHDPETPE